MSQYVSAFLSGSSASGELGRELIGESALAGFNDGA
jgi:hypothetical protein